MGPARRRAIALVATAVAVLTALALVSICRDAGSPPATSDASSPAVVPSPGAAGAIPAPAPERVLTRDLSGSCMPEPDRPICDPLRAGLWAGDPDAWRQWTAQQGQPALLPDQIEAATIRLRLEAGDAAARIDLARSIGGAAPVIASVRLWVEDGQRQVVAVEIVNQGAAAADLSGVTLAAGFARFPAGASLAPGGRCDVEPVPAAGCSSAAGGAPVSVAPGAHVQLVAPNGRILDDMRIP